jgi:hypothetical protein
MTLPAGTVAIVRFPADHVGSNISVAQVVRMQGTQALVRKTKGRNGRLTHWAKARWVPATAIARQATDRERVMGMPIDPVPPREVDAK